MRVWIIPWIVFVSRIPPRESLGDLGDCTGYKNDFLNLFGFGLEGVDYLADVNEVVSIPSIS